MTRPLVVLAAVLALTACGDGGQQCTCVRRSDQISVQVQTNESCGAIAAAESNIYSACFPSSESLGRPFGPSVAVATDPVWRTAWPNRLEPVDRLWLSAPTLLPQ